MESSVINHTERSNELAFIQDFPDLEIIFVICVYFYTYLQCLKLKMTCRNRADRFFLTCTFIYKGDYNSYFIGSPDTVTT